jgi:hypothetical protein
MTFTATEPSEESVRRQRPLFEEAKPLEENYDDIGEYAMLFHMLYQ